MDGSTDASAAGPPSIRLRQATGGSLQIADSDDEEGLQELAVEEETSYWTTVNAAPPSSPLPSPRDSGRTVKQAIIPHDAISPQQLPPVQVDHAESPDPMDLLARHDAGSSPQDSHEAAQVVADSDEEMPSQELDSDVELLHSHINRQMETAPSPDEKNTPSSPRLPPPLRSNSVLESDDELPSLGQALRPLQNTSTRRSPSPQQAVPTNQGQSSPPVASRGIKLIAVEATSSASSSEDEAGPVPQPGNACATSISDIRNDDVADTRTGVEDTNLQGRALRKRTQAQLQPYTTDWMKFAKTAQRNQWEGLVTKDAMYGAQHRPETAEEMAARLKKKAHKVHTHGGWLEPDEGQRAMRPDEEQRVEKQDHRMPRLSDDDDYDAPVARRAHESGTKRATHTRDYPSDAEGTPDIVFARSIRGEFAQGGISRPRDRQARRRSIGQTDNRRLGASASASSSRVTVEDQIREEHRRRREQKRRSNDVQKKVKKLAHGRTQSEPPSSPARPDTARKDRNMSSSPPRVPSAHRKKKPRLDRRPSTGASHAETPSNAPKRSALVPISDSEDEAGEVASSSDDEDRPSGDSPERALPADDRFALKGKRKKAAQAMMPAIFFKKAQKDLELMREEQKTGVIRHTLDREGSGEDDAVESDRAQAKVRLNPRNANKPIRFIADESTSESDGVSRVDEDSDVDEVETQQALDTWVSLAQAKNRSKDVPSEKRIDKTYWNTVIDNILVRDKRDRANGLQRPPKRRRRKKAQPPQSRAGSRAFEDPSPAVRRPAHRQQQVDDFYAAPTHLDDGDSLFAALPKPSFSERVTVKRRRPLQFAQGADDSGFTEATVTQSPAASVILRDAQRADESARLQGPANGSFSRFSMDFGIEPLPEGLSFSADSYIGRGHLKQLLNVASSESLPIMTVVPFGIRLDGDMDSETFLSMFPRICDGIFAECTSDQPAAGLLASASGQALSFAIQYMGLPRTDTNGKNRLIAEIERLECRIDEWAAQNEADCRIGEPLLVFRWYMLEVSFRAYLTSKSADVASGEGKDATQSVFDRATEVVRALLRAGPHHAMKAVQAARALATNVADGGPQLRDLHCEVWTCVIHLLSSIARECRTPGGKSAVDLWTVVEAQLRCEAEVRQLHPILRSEVSCYTAMAIACLSHFTADGCADLKSQMPACWPLFVGAIDRLKPQEFARDYSNLSNTGRTRLSRYIWTLYARCLIFATRWNWGLLDQSKLLGKLFDLVNAREFQDMAIEGVPDFPPFLADYAGRIGSGIEREDTVFRLLLRIVARMALEAEAVGTDKAGSVVARLAMRITPMRDHLSYPRQVPPGTVRKHRSVLINHYSLHILLAAVDAKNAPRRFGKFKAMLDFDKSDIRARQDCLRAITYLGIVYTAKGLDVAPILAWLAELAGSLRSQYMQSLRQRISHEAELRKASAIPDRPNAKKAATVNTAAVATAAQAALVKVGKDLAESAILMGVLLGCVQQLIQAGEGATGSQTEYPSAGLLGSAWIKAVLESAMARDPVVGAQVLNCINTYLALRLKALPDQTSAVAQLGESQDEYGDLDFDYDDPTLQAMLGAGEPEAAAKRAREARLKTEEEAVCTIIKTDISPALYHLLSNLNAAIDSNDGSGISPGRMRDYIADVVETWTASATVLVQNKQRDWEYYTGEFGKESWQRISDRTVRYEVGLHFAIGMLNCDQAAYKSHRDQAIELLVRGLAASSPPACVAELCACLLDIDNDCLLLRDLCNGDNRTTGGLEISGNRIAGLRYIFRNCKDILARRFCRAHPEDGDDQQTFEFGSAQDIVGIMRQQKIDAALVYRILGSMCSGMRDQLDDLSSRKLPTAQTYTGFCKQVCVALIAELGPGFANDRSIPQMRLLAGVLGSSK